MGSVRTSREPVLRRAARLGLAALSGCLAVPMALAEIPDRIVSMNLCTDQLAMMLAGPGQYLSVSQIALDPLSSPMAEQARHYPINHGGAEEIFLMRPDLVLAGQYSDFNTVAMLRRLGVPVVQIDLVRSLGEVSDRVLAVGAALGRMEAAQENVDGFETTLEELRPTDGLKPRAAFFYPNGYTLGTGTLSDDLLTYAGFTNIAVELGYSFGGRLPLESLVVAAPDLFIRSDLYAGSSRSEEILEHPALAAIGDGKGGFVSTSDWVCGTPFVLNALTDLKAVRAAILSGAE